MKKILRLTVFFSVLFCVACSKETEDTVSTILKIKNESSFEITDLVWQNVSFKDTIKSGENLILNVESGTGYLFFKRKSGFIIARTQEAITIEKNHTVEFMFINNTVVVENNNTNNIGTLSSIKSTPVWFDNALDTWKNYSSNDAKYHKINDTYSVISIGSSNKDADLTLRINLDYNAQLSFRYKHFTHTSRNFPYNYGGLIINGHNEEIYQNGSSGTSVISLNAGNNAITWYTKSDTYIDTYSWLWLDYILIEYTD